MLSNSVVLFLVAASFVPINHGARILVAFPMASPSHSILGHGIVRHLLEAGHEVVHITSFPRKENTPNLKEISLEVLAENIKKEGEKHDGFKLGNLVGKDNIDETGFLFFLYAFNQQFLQQDFILNFLKDPKEKFDVIVAEWFFSEAISGFASIFQCPLIWIGSTEAHWKSLSLVDEIPNPAYSVGIFSSEKPPLTFLQRVNELFSIIKGYALKSYLIRPLEKALYDEVLTKVGDARGVKVANYDDAVYNASMLLLNSHPSIGIPYRLPQSARYIGGYHIDTKVKPLPKDLQKIMDEAKNGVIYFSMGSNLKSSDLSKEMKESLLNMFSKLEQTVLWKFESDLQNIPPNIHLLKWAPQQSILTHPNLKMFITHGGLLSTMEAIHYGIPVIGVPVMGDQYINMKSVESKGFGIMVKLTNDLASNLNQAIKTMLQSSTYRLKAKELSAIFHDRPLTPGKELVHWVEHVARTKGAAHLRSPALMVPWYQKMFLDLLGLVIVFVFVSVLSLRILCKKLKNKFFGTKQKQKQK